MRITEEYQQVKITNLLSRIERNTWWSFAILSIIGLHVLMLSKDVYDIKKRYGSV